MGVELLGAAEASLLEHYLDTVEHLPDDVQRTISLLREIDHQYQHVLSELELMMCSEDTKKTLIQKTLIKAQELADEKLYHMQQLMDTIDNKSRQLEFDAKTLDKLNRHHSPATTFSECLSKERFLERNQNSPLAAHSSDDNSNQNIPNNSNISSSLNNNSSNNNNNGSNNNSIGSNNNSSLNNNSTTNNGGSNLTHSHNNNSLHSGNNLNSGTDRGGQQHVGKHKEDNIQSSSGGHAGAKRARRAAAAKDYSESSYDKREKRTSAQQNAKGSKRGSSDAGQGKKRKSARQQDVISPVDQIDPDEPLYCLCHQVSYGEMICCDNEECSMEWFHFSCVSLNTKPKGKWFCPRCRGDRSNQMKKIS